MKKRFISIFMAVLMMGAVMSTFAGCKKDDIIELTVYSQTANFSGYQAGFFGTLLEDKFNVKLNIVKDEAGTYTTRMENGNLGDIVVWGNNGEKYAEAVAQGMLFDWNAEDLLTNHGQYLKSNFSEALENNRQLNPDNKVYGIGHDIAVAGGENTSNHEAFFYTWDLRWDLYKQLGYPQIKTLDDYAEMLIDMKKICPLDEDGNPTYAVSLWPDWDGSMVMYVKAMASAFYGYDELGLGLYDSENHKFYDALGEGSPYLECLAFFNKLYRNDLIDPDSMTQTYDDMAAKVAKGGTFCSIFNFSGSIGYNTEEHISQGKMMCPLVPDDAKVITYGFNPYGKERIWSIGASTLYPEKCMEIINWLATPEGAMTMWYGLKGVHWDYDANGYTSFTPLGRECYFASTTTMLNDVKWVSPYTGEEYTLSGSHNDGKLQINNTIWTMSAINPDSNGERFDFEFWASEETGSTSAIYLDWKNHTGCNNRQEYLESKNFTITPPAVLGYSELAKDIDLKSTWSQVTSEIVTRSWLAMYASSASGYNNLVRAMRTNATNYGYDACVAWSVQEAANKFGENVVKA